MRRGLRALASDGSRSPQHTFLPNGASMRCRPKFGSRHRATFAEPRAHESGVLAVPSCPGLEPEPGPPTLVPASLDRALLRTRFPFISRRSLSTLATPLILGSVHRPMTQKHAFPGPRGGKAGGSMRRSVLRSDRPKPAFRKVILEGDRRSDGRYLEISATSCPEGATLV
jgi:hypothetical protein